MYKIILLSLLLCSCDHPWPNDKRTVEITIEHGIQAGMHWDYKLHKYITDWATCGEECVVDGFPRNEEWSDGVTVACYGFEMAGEQKEPLLFGICCEPYSAITFTETQLTPTCVSGSVCEREEEAEL